MGECGGNHAKCYFNYLPDIERHTVYALTYIYMINIYTYIYIWNLKKVQPMEPKIRMMVAKGSGMGEMRRCWSKGTKFQLEDE